MTMPTFTITTLPKALPNPNFIMVGGNGSQKGFSADEKTKEIFARVIGDIQTVADLKIFGHVHTYDLSIRTGVATIVTVKNNGGNELIYKTNTVNLYDIDDHENLDALRAQLAEKGHVFDCAHSFENSCDMRIADIKKNGPPKWKFWAKQPETDKQEIETLQQAKQAHQVKQPHHLDERELEKLEENNSTVSSASGSQRSPSSSFNEEQANDFLINEFDNDEILSQDSNGDFDLADLQKRLKNL